MRAWLKNLRNRLHHLRGMQPIYGIGCAEPAGFVAMGGSRLDHIRAALADPGKAPAAPVVRIAPDPAVRLDPEAMALLRSIDQSLKAVVRQLQRLQDLRGGA